MTETEKITTDKKFKVVGQNVERLDARAKATGEARFTVDLSRPGMLYAKFLRSPYAHARIRSVDPSEALKIPGVHAVVSHSDLQGMSLHNDTLDDSIRFLGEAVAGVAAESEDAADEALEKILIEYEPLPEILDIDEALKEDAPPVWTGGMYVHGAAHSLSQLEAPFNGKRVKRTKHLRKQMSQLSAR